jgi:hypothetical protein
VEPVLPDLPDPQGLLVKHHRHYSRLLLHLAVRPAFHSQHKTPF